MMAPAHKHEVGRCPNPLCGQPIWSDHQSTRCLKCGEEFPDSLQATIPHLQRLRAQEDEARRRLAAAGLSPRKYPAIGRAIACLGCLAVLGAVGALIGVIASLSLLRINPTLGWWALISYLISGGISLVVPLVLAAGLEEIRAHLEDLHRSSSQR
jgi:hypothetical protein